MFFILSKTIYFIAMPLSLIIVMIIISLFNVKPILKKGLRITAFSFLILFSNPFLANLAMKNWEGDPKAIKEVEHHELAVVLTGITNRYKKPQDRVYYERGADRVLHTIQLYKLGKIDKILISGGSGKLFDNESDIKESSELSNTFLIAGVSASDILLEDKSRNTHESAENCALIIRERQIEKILLVTSAFHIERSTLCFSKERISVTSFGTDYYSADGLYGVDDYITPKASAIQKWDIIIKEIIGIIVYKLVGYI